MTIIRLQRTVRLTIPSQPEHLLDGPNTYAGTPLSLGLGAYYEFHISCEGTPDRLSGWVASIYEIDQVARDVLPHPLAKALASGQNPIGMMPELYGKLSDALGGCLTQMRWTLNPYHHLEIDQTDMTHITISRRYTFSSAHHLQKKDLDEEANISIFGKCAQQSGHGHNFYLNVTVQVPSDASQAMHIVELDTLVMEHVINRLDHQNLNSDVPEFQELMPTLENITLICHQWLQEPLASTSANLQRVEVWETDRTSCSYPPMFAELSS